MEWATTQGCEWICEPLKDNRADRDPFRMNPVPALAIVQSTTVMCEEIFLI